MARVQMYTTRWCGYCVRAKALPDGKGIEYEEINLDDDPHFRQKLLALTGGWTVPQILLRRGGMGVDLRPPERLVDVDVPQAGECALVEERRLDRGAAVGEARAEGFWGEAAVERLLAEAGREVRLELVVSEQEPRAETAY